MKIKETEYLVDLDLGYERKKWVENL